MVRRENGLSPRDLDLAAVSHRCIAPIFTTWANPQPDSDPSTYLVTYSAPPGT